jgi:hypothetical protein
VARREGHLCFFDLFRVAGAYSGCVLDCVTCCAEDRGRQGTDGVTDGEEVWAQAADEPFDEGLEERCGCEGVAEAHDLRWLGTD